MINRPLVLMSKPPSEVIVTGQAMRVDGRATPSHFTHTIQIVASKFVGRVVIEASLMPSPTEADWFPIILGKTPYLDFEEPTSKCLGFTIQGRFVWVRAKIDRSKHVPIGAQEVAPNFGNIDRILFK